MVKCDCGAVTKTVGNHLKKFGHKPLKPIEETIKRTFHQLGNMTYDVDTNWVGRKQYVIHVHGVGDTWYLGSKRPTFAQTEYKVIELLERKGILK